MLHFALTIVQFVCATMIVLLVLVQKGKGAEAGAGFGAGASGTVFGARGAGTALSRATAIFAAVFMVNSLALGYVGARAPSPQQLQQQHGLLERAAETQRAPAHPLAPGGAGGEPPSAAAPPASVTMPSAPAPAVGGVPAAPSAAPATGASGTSSAKH
ncbi:MAG TPA: preprotein translocase subunit SecG [Steroidobacteraceae bacterium]|nr:preprotein translocase subunit SecG [Steroidobacteraceae bacterium]